jgi:hypothetical protein
MGLGPRWHPVRNLLGDPDGRASASCAGGSLTDAGGLGALCKCAHAAPRRARPQPIVAAPTVVIGGFAIMFR